MSTLDRVVGEVLADQQAARTLVRWAVAQTAYLNTRNEWDAEDNYATTEELVQVVGKYPTVSADDWSVIAIESGCEIECADCGELFSDDPGEVRRHGGKCPDCVDDREEGERDH